LIKTQANMDTNVDPILPAYFCLYPDMYPAQQKNRSKFANL
jgi:hypothetical protein